MILGNERPAEDLFSNSDHLLCESDQTWVERLLLLLKLHQHLQNERQHSLQVSLLQIFKQICQRLNIINSFDDDGGIPRSGLCCWCGIPREDPRNLICLNTTTHWGGHSTSSTLSTAARKKIKKEMTSRAERQNEDQEYQGRISATDHLTNVIE